jgi:RNA polymerase sigma-70 factor (ECF subfamily)
MDKLVQCETLLDSEPCETRELPEGEAIRRAQQGDVEAFARLYSLHSSRVYALCLRMMKGNVPEAEDLTQEAFLHVFRKIGTFRAESAFSTWLHRVTFNIVLMRLRQKKKTAGEFSLEETINPDDETNGPGRQLGAADPRLSGLVDRVNLQRAVSQLPAGKKSIFLLHDINGYEHNEIARLLGCSIGNSKSQLHKARVLLRRLLQKGGRGRLRHRHAKPDERTDRMLSAPSAIS